MKAKSCISIIPVLLMAALPLRAQDLGDVYLNDNATGTTILNNYHGDYDYYYTSRIFRFHRPYAFFDYYSPFFTDTYWYTYKPLTLGISIYRGGLGLVPGYNSWYPDFYSCDYYPDYFYSWNEPYYYNSFRWGFEPCYWNYWYSPVVFNPFSWSRWDYHHRNWYWDNRYYHNHFYHGDFGTGFYSFNRYKRSQSNHNNRSGRYPNHITAERPGTRRSDQDYNNKTNSVTERFKYPDRTGTNSNRRNTHIMEKPSVNTPARLNSSSSDFNRNTVSNNRRYSTVTKQVSGNRNLPGQRGSVNNSRNYNLADATTIHNNGNIQIGSLRNNNINKTTVNTVNVRNTSRAEQGDATGTSRSYGQRGAVRERPNSNFSGVSPATRRSLPGSVTNSDQARPLSSIQTRSSLEDRREKIAVQSHGYQESTVGARRSSQSISGEKTRRR